MQTKPIISSTKSRAKLTMFDLVPRKFTPLSVVATQLARHHIIRIHQPVRPKEVKWREVA